MLLFVFAQISSAVRFPCFVHLVKHSHPTSRKPPTTEQQHIKPASILKNSLYKASKSACLSFASCWHEPWKGEKDLGNFASEVPAPSLAGLIESTAIFQRLIKLEGSGPEGITREQIDFGALLLMLFGCLYTNPIPTIIVYFFSPSPSSSFLAIF